MEKIKKFINFEITAVVMGLCILSVMVSAYYHPVYRSGGIASDTSEYWNLSGNLLEDQKYQYTSLDYYKYNFPLEWIRSTGYLDKPISCVSRMPGYPLVLAILRLLWNHMAAGIILSFFVYTAIAFYASKFSRIFFKQKKIQRLYFLLFIFSPVYFIWWGVATDLVSCLYLTGFAYHLCVLFRLDKHNNIADRLMPIIWGALTIFTRPNLLIFVYSLIVLLIVAAFIRKRKKFLFPALIYLLIFSLSLGVWAYRNKKLTGQWTLSTQGGKVLFIIYIHHDVKENDPLYYWKKEGKANFLNDQARQGKTFNQAEAALDNRLKSIVWEHFSEDWKRTGVQYSESVRSFFFFSYHDISDLIINLFKPSPQRYEILDVNHHPRGSMEGKVHFALFQVSRMYKILIALSFIMYPLYLFFYAKKDRDDILFLSIIFIATLLATCSTILYTGAAGERMRMPLNAFHILFFTQWFSIVIHQIGNNKERKAAL